MTGYDDQPSRITEFYRPLAAYATLVRVPNLFTAPPDVVLGAAIAASLGHVVPVETIVGLSVASMLLYAAGTTLNDYFDATEDARERPDRPIPAGDISRRQALLFGGTLLGGGVAVAALSGGVTAGVVAAVLALAILSYDGVFNGSPTGFLVMGGCRGTNVLLGTAAALSPAVLPVQALSIPAIIVLYISGVTYMAETETETGESDSLAVSAAVVGTAVAVVGVVGALVVNSPSPASTVVAITLLVGFTVWTARPLRAAYAHPSPRTIGPAVGACVVGLTILTAAFAATVGIEWSLAAVVFFIPAVALARVVDVS